MPSTMEITAVVRETGTSTSSTYPILVHTLAPTYADLVTVRGAPEQRVGLEQYSAETNDIAPGEGVLLVAEGALDQQVANELRSFVDAGGTGVVLAQPPDRAAMYPFATEIQTIRAEWGGTPFRFTTDDPGIRAFPQRTVLHVHDADIAPEAVIRVPDIAKTAVGVFKPLPRPADGAVLAAVPSGQGVVVCCQYRLQAAIQRAGITRPQSSSRTSFVGLCASGQARAKEQARGRRSGAAELRDTHRRARHVHAPPTASSPHDHD